MKRAGTYFGESGEVMVGAESFGMTTYDMRGKRERRGKEMMGKEREG